jgi:NADH-quinone oxidoreductase subunit A
VTLSAYLPILLLVVLSSVFAIASIFVSSKLSPRKPGPAKMEPYECGILPTEGMERERVPVKFYLVAMLFIVFDIETVFLYPWAVAYTDLEVFGLIEMAVFIAILLGAYAYVWKRGGLEWAE